MAYSSSPDTRKAAYQAELKSYSKIEESSAAALNGIKGELLGYSKGLPFYDLFAPIASVDIQFTYEEAQDYIVNNFNTFSKKLGDFAQKAFNKKWIDAEPRDGKRGGAFCYNLHPIIHWT